MSSEHYRILLIEDNPADVFLFRRALESANLDCELVVLADGAQAVAYITAHDGSDPSACPDLAVMDLNLPKKDGVEVLEVLRKSPSLAHLRVVITSSSSSPYDRSKVERLRIERYIRKPPTLDEFMAIGIAVKEILQAQPSAASLRSRESDSQPHVRVLN